MPAAIETIGGRRARMWRAPHTADKKPSEARAPHYSTRPAKGKIFRGFWPSYTGRISSSFEHPPQQVQILRKGVIRGTEFFDSLHRMHHGCVIAAAELAPDLGQRPGCKLLCQIHRNLARPRHAARPAGREHVGQANVEVLCDLLLDLFDRDPSITRSEKVLKQLVRRLQSNGAPYQGGVGRQAV